MTEEHEFTSVFEDNKLSIYLAGAGDEAAYRAYAVNQYGDYYNLVNPMTSKMHTKLILDDPGNEMSANKRANLIVPDDKRLIESCNYVLAFMVRYTAGTCMEILFANSMYKPVIVIDPYGKFCKDLWIIYHALKVVVPRLSRTEWREFQSKDNKIPDRFMMDRNEDLENLAIDDAFAIINKRESVYVKTSDER